jgi:hypothetical protein
MKALAGFAIGILGAIPPAVHDHADFAKVMTEQQDVPWRTTRHRSRRNPGPPRLARTSASTGQRVIRSESP